VILSRFFSLAELTRSETARREGIRNDPGPAEVASLQALCTAVLDPLRESVGLPIRVSSGYRSPELNRRIRGAPDSQHVRGMAADLQASGVRVLDLFKRIVALGLPFDQVIYEAQDARTKWVHVSHDAARNRGEIRIAEFGANGRPVRYPLVTAAAALALQEPALAARGRGAVEALRHIEMDDAPSARAPVAKKKSAKRAKRRPAQAPRRKRAGTGRRKPVAAAARKAPVKSGKRRARG
jgi:hypothetical protein